MTRRDDQPLLNWLNLWLHLMKERGESAELQKKWIK